MDLAFYNVGCEPGGGKRRLVAPFRRALRRILRPMLVYQAEINAHIMRRVDVCDDRLGRLEGPHGDTRVLVDGLGREIQALTARVEELTARLDAAAARQEQSDRRIKTAMALGWDHVAVSRRLAAIEDWLVEQNPDAVPFDVSPIGIPFPGMEAVGPDR